MNKPKLMIALLAAVSLAVTASVIVVVGAISAQQQQQAYAITPVPCSSCAKEFAPGQEKIDSDFESTSAKPFAPGQEVKFEPGPCDGCNGASELAPGQEAKIIGPE